MQPSRLRLTIQGHLHEAEVETTRQQHGASSTTHSSAHDANIVAAHWRHRVVQHLDAGTYNTVWLLQGRGESQLVMKLSSRNVDEWRPYAAVMRLRSQAPEDVQRHLPLVLRAEDVRSVPGVTSSLSGVLMERLHRADPLVLDRISSPPLAGFEGSLRALRDPRRLRPILRDALEHTVRRLHGGQLEIAASVYQRIEARLLGAERIAVSARMAREVRDLVLGYDHWLFKSTGESDSAPLTSAAEQRLRRVVVWVAAAVQVAVEELQNVVHQGRRGWEPSTLVGIVTRSLCATLSRRPFGLDANEEKLPGSDDIPDAVGLRRAGVWLMARGVKWGDVHRRNIMVNDAGHLVFADLGLFDVEAADG